MVRTGAIAYHCIASHRIAAPMRSDNACHVMPCHAISFYSFSATGRHDTTPHDTTPKKECKVGVAERNGTERNKPSRKLVEQSNNVLELAFLALAKPGTHPISFMAVRQTNRTETRRATRSAMRRAIPSGVAQEKIREPGMHRIASNNNSNSNTHSWRSIHRHISTRDDTTPHKHYSKKQMRTPHRTRTQRNETKRNNATR